MNYKISHPTKVVECELDLPSSKSISNRLLIIRALCKEYFAIENLSDAEDTLLLHAALNDAKHPIDVGNAGTAFRFLTSFLAIQEGREFVLSGSERMKQRPIQALVDALKVLGAEIEYLEKPFFPPLKIVGRKLKGGQITIDGSVSSQFISSLLLVAPQLEQGLELTIKGHLVSKPYVLMTLRLMQEFGIHWKWQENKITIAQQPYRAKNYRVEADWSAATFWFQIAALSAQCKIVLCGLQPDSLQGDAQISTIFTDFGISASFANEKLILTKSSHLAIKQVYDLLEMPDLYPALRCTLFGLGKNAKCIGTSTLPHKESNRLEVVAKELQQIHSTHKIETHQDHRIAMAFAPLCLQYGTLQINHAEVVAKSYPNFWNDLQKGGFAISVC